MLDLYLVEEKCHRRSMWSSARRDSPAPKVGPISATVQRVVSYIVGLPPGHGTRLRSLGWCLGDANPPGTILSVSYFCRRQGELEGERF